MEFTSFIRVAVFLFLLTGNYFYFFNKEKYTNYEKFMFIIALSFFGYNGAKALFQF